MHPSSLAIMFADVSGSSGLYKAVGDAQARAIIAEAVSRMIDAVKTHDGTLVKTIGDEVMAHFPSADQAIAAAIDMQRASELPIQTRFLPLRIGVNFGPTLLEHGDVYGEAVNDAAALVKIARARQIVTNADTVSKLALDLASCCRVFDRVVLKGGKHEEDICVVAWEREQEQTVSNATVVGVLAFDRSLVTALQLRYFDQEIQVSLDKTPFHIGRGDDKCQLVIDSTFASRDHLHIEYRRGKFVLVDHSTNGTYVQVADSPALFLRREELPLSGRGFISVGQPLGTAPELILEFIL
jgi:adenylate cyclase